MPEERPHAERVLELPLVLALVAERCRTTLGSEAVLELRPTFDPALIEQRVSQTAEATEITANEEPPEYGATRDVREPVAAAEKGALLSGVDLFRVAETLGAMARLRAFLVSERERAPALWRVGENLAYITELQKALKEAVGPEGDVLSSASPKLRSLRNQLSTRQRRLATRLQSMVAGPLRTYLQEPIYTLREGRYVVPVKAQYRGKVPGIVHDTSGSGQTLFVEPEQMVADANRLREVEAEEREEVERVLRKLSDSVGEHTQEILTGIEALAELDCIFARARYAYDRKAEAPKLKKGAYFSITDGHHPLIPREESVPITVAVGGRFRSLLLTGPNTGGKTVTLKLLGLYALMIGCGIFPPARSVEYGPFSGVWADIGDEQSLQQSLSTFSGHLTNIAEVFKGAKVGDLVLLDEIGAGTDPREGSALGRAILESLTERGAVVAATTHFGELKNFAQASERFSCAATEFDMETLRPTYVLIPGASGASHALEISLRYGLPENVVKAAERHLGVSASEERDKSAVLDALIAGAREDRKQSEESKAALNEERAALAKEREAWQAKMKKTRQNAEERVLEAIREAREQYRSLLEDLKSVSQEGGVSGSEREKILERARGIEHNLRASRDEVAAAGRVGPPQRIERGMSVKLRDHGQVGRVVDVKTSGKVVVRIGIVKLTVAPEDLEPVTEEEPSKKSGRRGESLSVSKAQNAATELHLRNMRVEEATEALERFFDDAALAGLPRVRLVHGKGEGVLRSVVRQFLSSQDDVESVREGGPGEGGSGVTIVYFKP
ncbi:MAG: endonuclease MutS2 [Armatimonadetes bacterium]|nr:endonuclease MutS2 [Armatimonadota bacterium]